MKNTIRCCISCILPCGALDVIRIVHSNGRVQEISAATVRAADVMRAHPKHVLKKPSSSDAAVAVVPPDALLHRGNIYFLIPDSCSRKKKRANPTTTSPLVAPSSTYTATAAANVNLLLSDRYLTEILSEKLSTRRRGRAAVWRPHLESISESPKTTTTLDT